MRSWRRRLRAVLRALDGLGDQFAGHVQRLGALRRPGEHEGADEVDRWLARCAAVGIQIFPDEVVYENCYVIWGRMARGRLKAYEDTHKPEALDEYLTRNRPELAVA